MRTVLEQIGGDQIVGLRTLRDLRAAGLIELDHVGTDHQGPEVAPVFAPPTGGGGESGPLPSPPDRTYAGVDDVALLNPSAPPLDGVGSEDGRPDGLAEVAVMPPPIADDPWTPSADSSHATDDGVA